MYLTLTRFEYLEYEKLSRVKIIQDYYKTTEQVVPFSESFTSSVECAEHLAKGGKLTLPLKVRGIFLKEGRPERKYYYASELESSVDNPVNKSFPMQLDHKDKEVGSMVGVVTKIKYDPVAKGIRWWGHINSELHARNILDGIITQVSATVYSVADYDDDNGLLGRNLTYKELSLCVSGAVDGNYIETY